MSRLDAAGAMAEPLLDDQALHDVGGIGSVVLLGVGVGLLVEGLRARGAAA